MMPSPPRVMPSAFHRKRGKFKPLKPQEIRPRGILWNPVDACVITAEAIGPPPHSCPLRPERYKPSFAVFLAKRKRGAYSGVRTARSRRVSVLEILKGRGVNG